MNIFVYQLLNLSNSIYNIRYKWSNDYCDRKPISSVVKNILNHICKKFGTISIFTIVTIKDVNKDTLSNSLWLQIIIVIILQM